MTLAHLSTERTFFLKGEGESHNDRGPALLWGWRQKEQEQKGNLSRALCLCPALSLRVVSLCVTLLGIPIQGEVYD